MTGLEAFKDVLYILSAVSNYEIDTNCETIKTIEKELKALEIIKPLCEIVETPVKKYRYLKVNGVVVYTFKNEEEFNLLKEVLE
jgi:hypothetical protein